MKLSLDSALSLFPFRPSVDSLAKPESTLSAVVKNSVRWGALAYLAGRFVTHLNPLALMAAVAFETVAGDTAQRLFRAPSSPQLDPEAPARLERQIVGCVAWRVATLASSITVGKLCGASASYLAKTFVAAGAAYIGVSAVALITALGIIYLANVIKTSGQVPSSQNP